MPTAGFASGTAVGASIVVNISMKHERTTGTLALLLLIFRQLPCCQRVATTFGTIHVCKPIAVVQGQQCVPVKNVSAATVPQRICYLAVSIRTAHHDVAPLCALHETFALGALFARFCDQGKACGINFRASFRRGALVRCCACVLFEFALQADAGTAWTCS